MSNTRWLAAGILVLAAACGSNSDSEFADATPDVSGMQLEITGNSAEGVVRDDGSDSIAQDVTLSTPPEYLAKTRAALKELNEDVKKALTPIAALVIETAKSDAKVGDARVFGPKDQGNANWKLTVKKKADKKFGFKLEARPLGSTDDSAFKTVAVGELDRAAETRPHRGKGIIGLDLDAYASIDTSSKATGKLLAAFAHAGEGKVILYRLKGFTPDSSTHAAVSGTIYGHKTPSGEAVVRFASLSDVVTGSALELMLGHLHWMPGIGGRADLLMPNKGINGQPPNGDVPADKFYIAKSCWNGQEVESFKAVGTCTVGQGPSSCVFDTAGSASACTASGKDPQESDSKDDNSTESGAPAQLPGDAPSDLPTF